MRTKEQVEELVVSAFGKMVNMEANLSVKVYPQKRELFVKTLRVVFNDLRLRNSHNMVTLQQFADLIYAEEVKKQEFFENVRKRINEITKQDYAPDSIILKEKEENSLEFFFDFSKIINPLTKEFGFSAPYTVMLRCRTPYQLADLFYRRGQF